MSRIIINLIFLAIGLVLPFILCPFVYADCIATVLQSTSTGWCDVSLNPEPANGVFQVCRADENGVSFFIDYISYACDSTASNGVQDSGEEGIDCGGDNPSVCVSFCPGNTEELYGPDGVTLGCFWYGLTDKYGTCPPSSQSSEGLGVDGACYKQYDYVLAADTVSVPSVDPPSFLKGTFSVVSSSSGEIVVDNGNGTETATITTRTIDSDGNDSTTVTSVDRPSGSPTGTGFSGGGGTGGIDPGYSGTSETDEDTPPEENPDNYSLDSDKEFDSSVDENTGDRFSDRFSGFIERVKSAPIFDSLAGVFSGPPSSTLSVSVLSLGSWGDFNIDFSIFAHAFNGIGFCLVGASLYRAVRLVLANK